MSESASSIKVASFNINGIKARLPRLIEWLEETQPDIACLQEIKTQDEGFPAADFAAIGYEAIWHGQKGFNGVAILARGERPVEVQRGLAGEPEDEHSAISKPTSWDFGWCASTCPTAIRSPDPSSITSCAGWSG
jgi:exodeoxyribonuclease-3